jgi:hypothetical protein
LAVGYSVASHRGTQDHFDDAVANFVGVRHVR